MPKRGGARREDVEAKRLIERNRATIERLADHLSGGTYSASRRPRAEPQPEGLIIHVGGGPPPNDTPKPYVRISPNDRVVVADGETGRQLRFLGQIRQADGGRRFVLASRANSFVSLVDPDVEAALAGLDGRQLGGAYDEDRLAADIRERLGIA